MNNELQDMLRAILKEELEPIKNDISEIRKELTEFKETTESNFRSIEQKVDKRFDATGEVLSEAIYESREIAEKVDALAELYGKVETNVNVLSNRLKRNNQIQ